MKGCIKTTKHALSHVCYFHLKNWNRIACSLILFAGLFLQTSYANTSSSNDSINTVLQEQINIVTNICNQKPDDALIMANDALKIAQSANNDTAKAELLRLIGLISFYKVDYAKSLDYFSQSHRLFVQLNNKDGEASALNNISLVYRTQGFLDKALKMDQTVLNMRKQLNDPDKLAGSYNNMAVAYLDLKNFNSALNNYKKAVSISISNNILEDLDLYYNNIGDLYFQIDLMDSAYYYFQKSLTFSIPLNHKQIMANSYIYLGQYYLNKGEFAHAKYQLKKGLQIAQEVGIVYEIEDAARHLHEAYALSGDYQNAYKIHLLYKHMADSAKNIEAIQKITQIDSDLKYNRARELDQIKQDNQELADQLEITKQKQARNAAILVGLVLLIIAVFSYINYKSKSADNIELLKQKDEIMAQKEEIILQRNRIEALNATKDKFFAIIAHDLRNPLGGIFKLSEVIYNNLEFISKEKLEKYLKNIKTTTEGVYLLLDNLLNWASIQSGSIKVHPHRFNLSEVIQENKVLLTSLAIQKNISIHFDETSESMAYADKEMISTVLRNLMTNAIKFTPEQGKLSVDLERKNNFWQVSITDTGVGISPEDQQLLFTLLPDSKNLGHSREKGIGLGLILCKEFTVRNGGEIWVSSEIDKGSTFVITIPLSA
ncbi:MAG: tetratricopeptide repeat protein [Prolixibacteraceae bacterium]